MNKRRRQELLGALALVLALAALCAALSVALLPPRTSYGATWDAYLAEERDSLDVLYFGSSLSYCNIIPAVVWQHSGIPSYGMAGPEQTPSATYYYVREALRTQSPQAVLIEITGVFYPRYTSFTKVNIGYMPWGLNRAAAIVHAAEPEERTGLWFPLYNYHDRWPELRGYDWTSLWTHPPDALAGYTYLDRIAKLDGVRERVVDFDEQTYRAHIGWLGRIAELCREEGVTAVFYLSPSCYRLAPAYRDRLVSDLPDGVIFRDFNDGFDGLGLDVETDFYDYMHFNWRGAETFSAVLAQWLTELGVTPGPCDSALWQARLEAYQAQKEETP